ncbi:MAG: PKD domain-containing protein [bacterium]
MRKKNICLCLVLFIISLIASCNKEGGGGSQNINVPPVAKLSIESKGDLVSGNPVVLNASLSTDENGDALTYLFEVTTPNGPLQSSDSDLSVYSFVPKEEGHYIAKVTVKDDKNAQAINTILFSIVKLEISAIKPEVNTYNVPINLGQLKWECNGCSDTRYKVYFATTDTMPGLITDTEGITEKNFTIGMLPYNAICAWRVVANNNGCIADTGIINFYTAESNSPPIVQIVSSKDRYVEGDIVNLISKVADADDESFTFNWEFISIPSGSLVYEFDAPTDANTSFQADANGVYEIKLTVTDAKGAEGSAIANINVEIISITNLSPVANSVNQPLNLKMSWNCNAEDAIFKIKFGKCSDFSNADTYDLGKDKFFNPAGLALGTTYCAQVIVNNNGIVKTLPMYHTDWRFTTASESAENQAPVANAGENISVTLGEIIIFDASASSDPDGDDLTFFWKVEKDGEYLFIEDPNQETIWFFGEEEGTYIGTVTVSDGRTQTIDTVEANVSLSNNQKPVADIKVSKYEIAVGEILSLDGSYSYDPDGDLITYKWKLEGAGELYDANSAHALYTSNTPGAAELSLMVNDGQVDSNSVSVEISVIQSNEELYLSNFYPDGDPNVPLEGITTWESNGEAFDVFFSFDGGNTFELVKEFQTEKSFSLQELDLEKGKIYYYSIIAYGGEEYLISDILAFKTIDDIPALFISITDPDDRSSNVPVNTCLKWAGNGDLYKIFMRMENREYVSEIASTSKNEYCLRGDSMLAGETKYFLKVVAIRGEETVQEEIQFTTAPFSIVVWEGIDITFTTDGIVEIRNYYDYLTDDGREAIDNGAMPVLEGDITLWDITNALSEPCSFTNGTLTIDLNKAPLLEGCNAYIVNLGKDGQRVAWSQFHLFEEDDKEIILRKKEGTEDWILATSMQIKDGRKVYSPCPEGKVVTRNGSLN